ncbi:MAG: asparagine synthase-related protein [Xanthobacteraceae bacterium]
MKSGLYGVARLDGGSADIADCKALGLAPAPGASAVAAGVDTLDPGAIHTAADGDLCILLGYLDEPQELAARLGLSPDTDFAKLALAAHERFGAEAPAVMFGEWSCLFWNADERRLTLMTSRALRDPVLYARHGDSVAIAPSIHALSRLSWISRDIDPDGFTALMATYRANRPFNHRSLLRGVEAMPPGSRLTFCADGFELRRVSSRVNAPPFTGTFEDALAEAEATLRRIMRQHLARHDGLAVMVSGGLDSSTLSWLAATELTAGQRLTLLTSAAPQGSGLPDETSYARIVADHLGQPLTLVSPSPEARLFRPTPRHFLSRNNPTRATWHHLYEAFFAATRAAGRSLLIDGSAGEYTLTAVFPLATAAYRLRGAIRRLRDRLDPRRLQPHWPDDGFNVRLASGRLANLPPDLAATWHLPLAVLAFKPRARWGYCQDINKLDNHPSEPMIGGPRMVWPFRDQRLQQLFSGFPATFSNYGGMTRSPARALLAGKLPDSIRLRTSGVPFCPDFYPRLTHEAPEARARLPILRRAGIGEWLDLDWLEQRLAKLQADWRPPIAEAFQIQLTANVAEFLLAWYDGASALD